MGSLIGSDYFWILLIPGKEREKIENRLISFDKDSSFENDRRKNKLAMELDSVGSREYCKSLIHEENRE